MKVNKKIDSERDAALRKAVKRKAPADSTEDTAFNIAVKNIQQILKKKEIKKKLLKEKNLKAKAAEAETEVQKPEKVEQKEKKKSARGVIYLGHVPHGFYEEQMKDYFKQFGKITRMRLARSRKTGQSRGYAFIEFEHTEVARIAAETMNNYLMCGRLLKAMYIPPEKQHKRYFLGRNWTKTRYPRLMNRKKTTVLVNKQISDKKHTHYVNKSLNRLSALQTSLEKHGISIKFNPINQHNE